jgi:DNA-binding HxlR family transcriptional regulator
MRYDRTRLELPREQKYSEFHTPARHPIRMKSQRRLPDLRPLPPNVPFEFCPIRASLGVLGRKWALLVLRDVAFFARIRFSEILRNNPGMGPRILSMRLRELEKEGFIQGDASRADRREVTYRLTRKGLDVMPILTSFIQFGIRYHAERVFEDGRSRNLEEVYPVERPRMLGRLLPYAEEAGRIEGPE